MVKILYLNYSFFFLVNLPILLPNIFVAIKPHNPPNICTTLPPAKS